MPAKRFNTVLVIVMVFLTLAGIAGSSIVIANNHQLFWDTIVGDNTNVKLGSPRENCESVAQGLNMTVDIDGADNFVITRHEINNHEMLFAKTSALIMACTQYRLDSMCVGTECPGAQFKARLVKIQ